MPTLSPRRRIVLAGIAAAMCVACGGASEAETSSSEPAAATSGDERGANQQGTTIVPVAAAPLATTPPPTAGAGTTGDGRDFDHPVATCGAMESYLYIARTFQCPEGGNPLGGDWRAGAGARLGSGRSHGGGTGMLDSHIVDLYEVPCGSGPVRVYVCLYHCPAGRTPLD